MYVCIVYVLCMYLLCIYYACIYYLSIMYVYMYCVCIMCVLCMYVFIMYVLCMYVLCMYVCMYTDISLKSKFLFCLVTRIRICSSVCLCDVPETSGSSVHIGTAASNYSLSIFGFVFFKTAYCRNYWQPNVT
jgi:hypothetical protein